MRRTLTSRRMSVKKPVKKSVLRPGPVLDAVNKVGGVRKAAALMDVPTQTVYAWIEKGVIVKATAAVLLSRASGYDLDKLIGLK
jgi:hypothetical protein